MKTKRTPLLILAALLCASSAFANKPSAPKAAGERPGSRQPMLSQVEEARSNAANKRTAGQSRAEQQREEAAQKREAAQARAEQARERAAQNREAAKSRSSEGRAKADEGRARAEENAPQAGSGQQAMDRANNRDKTDAERREAGRGSETGQQMREERSRKWWRFWGE